MKNIILAICMVSMSISYAQSDTAFYELNKVENKNSYNLNIKCHQSTCLVLNASGEESSFQKKLFLLDKNLEVINQINFDNVEGHEVTAVNDIIESNNGNYIIFANTTLSNPNIANNYIALILYKVVLNKLSIIDSILINNNRFGLKKLLHNKSHYFAWGNLFDDEFNSILSTGYIGLNQEAIAFEKYLLFENLPQALILNSVFLNDSTYFISDWNRESYLLNIKSKEVTYISNEYNYTFQNIHYNDIFTHRECYEEMNKIFCYSTATAENKYNFSKVTIDKIDKNYKITEIDGFLPEENLDDIVDVDCYFDESQYICATGFSIPFDNVTTPNNLYIKKLDKNSILQWELIFNNGKELNVRYINEWNDDLLIVGSFQSIESHYRKDFLLKINKMGKVTSTTDNHSNSKIVVYPNPATNLLFIKSPQNYNKVDIIDINGKKLEVKNIDQDRIDISSLNNGIYFIEIFKNNILLFRTKFVKIE